MNNKSHIVTNIYLSIYIYFIDLYIFRDVSDVYYLNYLKLINLLYISYFLRLLVYSICVISKLCNKKIDLKCLRILIVINMI